jgi:Bax protein
MNSQRPAQLLGLLFTAYAAFCLALVLYLGSTSNMGSLDDDELSTRTQLPDFAAIEQTPERKQQFLALLQPMIAEKNEKLLRSRARLEKIQQTWNTEQSLSGVHQVNLQRLRDKFHVTQETYPEDDKAIAVLLLRVDAIPPAMVLAQAAVESGWGTSRFAEEAHNLFGQWCYKPGCGLVPNKRAAGAKHEIKQFNNVEASLVAYFNNINTHNAYRSWRQLRAQLRHDPKRFTGGQMVAELGKYSGRGTAYIQELRRVIRANNLETYAELNSGEQALK